MSTKNLAYSAKPNMVKIDGNNYTLAAGTGDTSTSTTIDLLGYNAIRIMLLLGAIVATGTVAIQLNGSDDGVTWAAVSAYQTNAGTSAANGQLNATAADANTIMEVDLYRPAFRYLQIVTTRATANATLLALLIEKYLANNEPVDVSGAGTAGDISTNSPVVLNAPKHA